MNMFWSPESAIILQNTRIDVLLMHFHAPDFIFQLKIYVRNRGNDVIAQPLRAADTDKHSAQDELRWGDCSCGAINIVYRPCDCAFHHANKVSATWATWVLCYVVSRQVHSQLVQATGGTRATFQLHVGGIRTSIMDRDGQV